VLDHRVRPIRHGLLWSVIALAAAALAGLVAFWPRGDPPEAVVQPGTYVNAVVTGLSTQICESMEAVARTECTYADIEITSGPDATTTGVFVAAEDDLSRPNVVVGDEVVVLDVPTSPSPYRYVFWDYQRTTPLLWLALVFVIVVVAFGRWQGLRALLGLGASVLILVAFMVPSLLRDQPAVLVALTGSILIAVLALYLAHGLNMATTVALAGTLVSLLVICFLALAAASLTSLSGLADEQAQILRVTAGALDLRGLLVAGIVVGALGVLDDVTVTQVSTVAALRRTDPTLSTRALYGEAIRVGRDHVASTVNTLVLAYAGAALPLVLLFAQGTVPVARILTGEIVAVEVVRMLVGSIGLVLSVPITTALAAVVLTPTDEAHGHDHHATDHPAPGGGPAGAPESVPARTPEPTGDVRPDGYPTDEEPSSGWDRFAPDTDETRFWRRP
jgi:uncharacterized membrane protein